MSKRKKTQKNLLSRVPEEIVESKINLFSASTYIVEVYVDVASFDDQYIDDLWRRAASILNSQANARFNYTQSLIFNIPEQLQNETLQQQLDILDLGRFNIPIPPPDLKLKNIPVSELQFIRCRVDGLKFYFDYNIPLITDSIISETRLRKHFCSLAAQVCTMLFPSKKTPINKSGWRLKSDLNYSWWDGQFHRFDGLSPQGTMRTQFEVVNNTTVSIVPGINVLNIKF